MSGESFVLPSSKQASRTASFSTLPSLIETEVSSSSFLEETTSLKTFDLYPLSHHDELKRDKKRVVVLHVIRHAEGTHNVNKAYRDVVNMDARLTPRGKEQCAKHAASFVHHNQNPQLIVTSPLTRCVQTALLSFPALASRSDFPIVALEHVRETVNYNCDRRRSIQEIAKEFPRVDFSLVSNNEDPIWDSYQERLGAHHDSHRESGELHVVANRGRQFFSWLQQEHNHDRVILCTHSAFLRCILGWGQGEGGVLNAPPQALDSRHEDSLDVPVVRYCGDEDFESRMREDYENCEMRSFLVAFP